MHGLSECLGVDVVWIEMATGPLQHLGMFLVVWISERIKELAVSPRAADILWRAASGCIDEAGIDNAGNGISDANRVLPAVAEVVGKGI